MFMPSNMGIWIVIRVIAILLINYLSSYVGFAKLNSIKFKREN